LFQAYWRVERLAACANNSDRPDWALKLEGAGAAMRENLGISLSTAEREQLDQTIHTAMTADQVLEFVLGAGA
jgi:hypothetical protein